MSKRMVHFSDEPPTIYDHDDGLLAFQRRALSVSDEEFAMCTREIAIAFRAGYNTETDLFSWRGLERVLHGTVQNRQAHRTTLVQDVVTMYDNLKGRKSVDHDTVDPIAMYCHSYSKADQEEARELAKLDARVAGDIYRETCDETIRELMRSICRRAAAAAAAAAVASSKPPHSLPQKQHSSSSGIPENTVFALRYIASHKRQISSHKIPPMVVTANIQQETSVAAA
jgi:hypothetical protein